MPELPEVETVVQSIRDQLIGNEFENIEIRWPKVLYNFSKSDFLRNLAKRKIERVDRRAKFIIIGFNKSILAIHLRMTGKLYFQNNLPQKKHISAIITMSNGNYLIFEDTRKFGKFYYYKSQNYLNNKLGIEPLSNDMNYCWTNILLLDWEIYMLMNVCGNVISTQQLFRTKSQKKEL